MAKDSVLTVGSRAQVMHGTAKRTSGGLTKKDLKYNKSGEIVSKKKSEKMKKGGTWKKRFGKKLAKPFGSGKKTRKVRKGKKGKTEKKSKSRK
jgi:hypothetical protein